MRDATLYLLQNLLVIDVLIIAIWLLDKRFQWNIGHLWRKGLWMLICVRMIFPVEIHLQDLSDSWNGVQIELEVKAHEKEPEIQVSETGERTKAKGVQIYEPVFSETKEFEESENPIIISSILGLLKKHCEVIAVVIWILGFAITLFHHIFQYYFVKEFYFKEAKICENSKTKALLHDLCEKYHIKNIPEVLEKGAATTPMTFGYLKKKLVFPQNTYDENEISLILQHELTHIKYFDSWYKTFLLIVCDLYWFNPLFLLMKRMAYRDVEYVCDERITKNMSQEEKQIYGKVILKTANTASKKTVPSMVQFSVNKKELKKRLGNLFEFKSWHKGIVPLLLGVVFWAVFVTGFTFTIQETSADEFKIDWKSLESEEQAAGTYYTEDIEALYDQKDVESSYIKERKTSGNYYFIDEEGTLWGTGNNDCYQLNIDDELYYETPVEIAENVIHVDVPEEGFCVIWLTEDGTLYGRGENRENLLQMKTNRTDADQIWGLKEFSKVPQLLMENVLYASAGRECISVLTKNKEIYWWGELNAPTATKNTSRMVSQEPVLALKNARYTVCGLNTIAAIDEKNQLWLWGNNVWGQCGIESEEDYVTEPYMAVSDVEMVWPEYLATKENDFEKIPYTTFIRKTDGKIYACGIDLGHYVKSVKIYGNMDIEDSDNPGEYIRDYSPFFLYITVEDNRMEEL